MMFLLFHSTVFLGLIALAIGAYLIMWSSRLEVRFYQVCAWILGLVIGLSAIFGLICVEVAGIKYMRANGYANISIMDDVAKTKPMMSTSPAATSTTTNNKR